MNVLKLLFATLTVSLALTGCESFDDLNTDKFNPPYITDGDAEGPKTEGKYADIDIDYSVSDAALQELIKGQNNVGSLFAIMTYEGCLNDYQVTTNLTHDIYSAYVANNKPNFNEGSPSYAYNDGWSAKRWNHFYADRTTKEYAQLLRTFYFVDKEKYKNAFYITRIYWAFLASMNTDTYGDMPFTIYANGRTVGDSIPYNTQKDVYDGLFRMLEQSVDSIQPENGGFKFTSTEDLCYGGDETKWLKFANSLRLRLALRISNVDPERAKAEGEAALANKWGIMESDDDRMKTVPRHAPVEQGGKNAGGDENPLAMCSFYYNGDCVMSKDLELAYKNLSTGGTKYELRVSDNPQRVIDPRCAVCWWRPSPLDALKEGVELPFIDFTGCEIGDFDVKHTETVAKYSVTRTDIKNSKVLDHKKWFSASREAVWFGYAETRFLLAEAALRGWAGATSTPLEYFKDGIKASMNYFEISSSDADSYLNGLKVLSEDSANPFLKGDQDGMLEAIITQKWLAVFPNGNEGWAEFRRTGYPKLALPLHNLSGGEVPEGQFIKRIKYPFSEIDNEYRPKDDSQGIRLWWDVPAKSAKVRSLFR